MAPKHTQMKNGFIFIALAALFFFSSSAAFARVGVGMGAGTIKLTDQIKPGGIYTLPALRVFNTGDETTTYGMDVAYGQDYPQMRPAESWFSFSPSPFTLKANESQLVQVTMTVPVNAVPGDYFAFVESGPVASNAPGTTVGVAVGTKLFFTVVPANLMQAVAYRVSAFFAEYSPWSWIGLALLLLVAAIITFRRYFSFNIAVRKN